MKCIFLILGLLFLAHPSNAQSPNAPPPITYEVGEDYTLFENDVLRVSNWMINGQINEEFNQYWKEATEFLTTWINESPTVYIMIQEEFVSYIEKHPPLLMIFMAGWTKYSLETKIIHDNLNGNLAGLD